MTPEEVNPYRNSEAPEPFRCPNCGRELKTVPGFKRHLQRHIADLDPQVFPRGRKAWLRENGYTVEGE